MLITHFFLLVALISQANTVTSDCPWLNICSYNATENIVICDGNNGNGTDFPSYNDLEPVENYFFNNFQQIPTNAFNNTKFLNNTSIKIHLMNITTIETDAFSATMIIPDSSTVSIYIENPNDISNITLETHAFNNINIDRLHFININSFNGKSILETQCFGPFTKIRELTFKQSNLTGFSSSGESYVDVQYLSIRECPSFTRLTADSLPLFLGVTKTLEISETGLEFINQHTFQGWSFVFEKLVIKNNINLKIFPTDIVDTFFMNLKILDLSNNSIVIIDPNYDWSPYYEIKHLILKQQQKLDLFLKSDILKSLSSLTTIDFSEGIISENDEDLISDHVPIMSNLAAINISYTNFTDDMVIDLLTILSKPADQIMQVSLLDHTLNDSNFCSYFQIFRQAPNLLRLELDETHECNCIIDLFYDDEHIQEILNDSLIDPTCVLNTIRPRCNIQSQLILSKCPTGSQNSDDSNKYGDIGNYAFIGIMVGLSVILIALLVLGSSVVYRARKVRRRTILNMEFPVDSSSIASIEELPENSSSEIIQEPLQNAF